MNNNQIEIDRIRESLAALAVVRALDGYMGYSCQYALMSSGQPALMIFKGDELVAAFISVSAKWLYQSAREAIRAANAR